MLEIYIIRPGSTEFDRQGRIQGNLDVPLNVEGRKEVGRVIDQLRERRFHALYCAPCEAAEQTAQAIADALGTKSKVIEKLQNIDHGLWQGMLIDDVKTKQPKVYRKWQEQPESICPPQGEMLSAARQRVQQAMAKLLKKHREGAIGLVVPGPIATLVRLELRGGKSLGDLWKSEECGKWEVVVIEPSPPVATG
ncbi:MAG: histidine phosphatase family protein [Pirellulales bacterium]